MSTVGCTCLSPPPAAAGSAQAGASGRGGGTALCGRGAQAAAVAVGRWAATSLLQPPGGPAQLHLPRLPRRQAAASLPRAPAARGVRDVTVREGPEGGRPVSVFPRASHPEGENRARAAAARSVGGRSEMAVRRRWRPEMAVRRRWRPEVAVRRR